MVVNIENKNLKFKLNSKEYNMTKLSTYNQFKNNNIIDLNKLKKDDYFNDLVYILHEKNIIDDHEVEKINYARMENLQVLLKYYTKDESSSVTIEAAEEVFKSLNFTLGVYMRQFNNIEEITNKLKNESIEYMFEKGRNIVKSDVIYTENLLKKIQKSKLDVNNYSYDDTIDYGLSKFYKTYNDLFSAHTVDADVDYQLAIDIGDYVGVEYMKHYLERLQLEDKFCNYFDSEEIKNLLYGYNEKYELLLLNIFEIILTNCIGHILSGNNNIKALNITKYEKDIIKNYINLLSEDTLKNKFNECCLTIGQLLDINDSNLISYMKQCSQNMIPYIKKAIKYEILNEVFISFNEKLNNNIIEYVDKESLSNEKFRSIAECVRNADTINTKITIINTKIHSLTDLNDILDADCLFGDEYKQFFSNLSKMQIILLIKYIDEYGRNKEWHEMFFQYLNCMTNEEMNYINSIKKRINLV